MSRRTMHWALLVLGIFILVATVVAALITRASDTATATLPAAPAAPVVVTEPGVLDVVASEVTIRADVEGEGPVVLAVGRTADVEAWLGDAEHERVTGLSSWDELTVETVTPEPGEPDDGEAATEDPADADAEEPAPGQLPDPSGSDLWVAEVDGDGEAELTWQDRPGRWSLVAATDGSDAAPQIELEWGRERSTPWLWPGLLLGGLLALIGGGLLVVATLARREQQRSAQRRARQELDWQPGAEAVALPLVNPTSGERYTRRELRQMQQAAADAEAVDRAVDDDAPPIPAPDELDVGDPEPTSADAGADEAAPADHLPVADGSAHSGPGYGVPGDGEAGDGGAGTAAIDAPSGATRDVSGALGEQGGDAVSPTSPQSTATPGRPTDEAAHEPDGAHGQIDPPADLSGDGPAAGGEAPPRRGWWARLFSSRQALPADGAQAAGARTETAHDDPVGTHAEPDGQPGDDALAGDDAATQPSGVAVGSTGAQRSAPTPTGTSPDVTDPDGTDPDGTDPDVTDLDGTDPDVTDLDGTDPDVTDLDGTDPDVTDLDGTDPDVGDPRDPDPAAGVTEAGPEPTDGDDDEAARSPSWRSVWGFGQSAPRPGSPEDPPDGPHIEGDEQR